MGFNLKYIDDGKGIEAIATSKVSKSDFINACNETFNQENINNHLYQIVDLSQCDSFELSSSDINELTLLAINASKQNSCIIIAFIAPNDLVFGMSRMYESYSYESGFKIKVFREKEAGESWVQSLLWNNA